MDHIKLPRHFRNAVIFNLLLIIIFPCSQLRGQKIEEFQIANGIYLLPTQLVFPEILLTYEHFVKDDLSLSFSMGYKFPTGSGDTLEAFGSGLLAEYENQYMFNEYLHGMYLSVAPSFYFSDTRNFYWSPELFYRYYWCNDKRLYFDNVETDRFNSIRSEQNHVIGLKLLAGYNSKIDISEKCAIAFKFFGGLGTRYKIYKYENVDNVMEDGTTVPYEMEQGTAVWPVAIQLGVKAGLSNLKVKNNQ